MFEIRIVCDPADTDRVSAALSSAFTTGAVRQHPGRDGQRTRLYITAEHRPEPGQWPTPAEAYTLAPSIISEIGWTADRARMHLHGRAIDREYWLRKAALLDRMALDDDTTRIHADAPEVALNAALRLMEIDHNGDGAYSGDAYGPEYPETLADPRGYVRRAYAHWAKNR
ncbi:hypothetical protein ACF1GT_12780 [Streptomyces sp. NPDC014636]|uniref:hypothetical protein n=1 Tax=Streptomyces sp. NPDC014636 TaxID=3364876 RepID=UPI0036FA8836